MNDRASVRITEGLERSINNSIRQLTRRYVAAHPWPFETDDTSLLYLCRSCMPEDIASALAVLENDEVIMKSDLVDVNSDSALYVGDIKLYINFKTPYAVLNSYTRVKKYATIEEDHPRYEPILEWATKATTMRNEAEDARYAVSNVLDHVSTTGQLKRVWPDLLPLLPNSIQASLNTAQRASRINEATKEAVADMDLTKATQTLALLSMLDRESNYKVYV